ncbi:MAG: Asp-tRNA(Asn)/Glu-tRNA(Gln) amidotransferase subunit GatC [Candidatus Bathyarchaeota archaeon]
MDRRLSKEQVEHVAWLARIHLSEEEKELFTKQLNDILNYFNKINELNTEDVPLTYQLTDMSDIFRSDKVTSSLTSEKATQNAPKTKEGYFKSPKIV